MKKRSLKSLIAASLCATMVITLFSNNVAAGVSGSAIKNSIVNQNETVNEVTYAEEVSSELSEIKYDEGVSSITINTVKGYEEGAYVKWAPVTGADGYLVYYSDNNTSFLSMVDDNLIRNYGTYFRADAVGIPAGDYYFKIDAIKIDSTTKDYTVIASSVTEKATVTSYDRSGYAFVSAEGGAYNEGSVGAYNANGTLKSNAIIIYLTEENKESVKATINNSE